MGEKYEKVEEPELPLYFREALEKMRRQPQTLDGGMGQSTSSGRILCVNGEEISEDQLMLNFGGAIH